MKYLYKVSSSTSSHDFHIKKAKKNILGFYFQKRNCWTFPPFSNISKYLYRQIIQQHSSSYSMWQILVSQLVRKLDYWEQGIKLDLMLALIHSLFAMGIYGFCGYENEKKSFHPWFFFPIRSNLFFQKAKILSEKLMCMENLFLCQNQLFVIKHHISRRPCKV